MSGGMVRISPTLGRRENTLSLPHSRSTYRKAAELVFKVSGAREHYVALHLQKVGYIVRDKFCRVRV